MTLPTDPPSRHREIAAGFTARVVDVTDPASTDDDHYIDNDMRTRGR